MIKGNRIKRIFAAYDEVNLVFGAGIEPYLEVSSRMAEKSGYKLESKEDRRNAILDIYKNGYLPKYIYTELSACMNGKDREVCPKKDIEFLYVIAESIYNTASIKEEDFTERYKDFMFGYDSLERSWASVDEAFAIYRKGKKADGKSYRIVCYVPSGHIMDSDKKLFGYMYGILDNHHDMIVNGFPDGNDKIETGYPEEFEEAFRILSVVDPLYWRVELCVFFQFK